ncbi:hypothetical protein U1Q18_011374 [Sarracenia purpurea var. burkii]
METRKPITKAAARAWNPPGSESAGRPAGSPYNFRTTRRPPEPFRQATAGSQTRGSLFSRLIHADDSSGLLDTYEIERISRQLDYYIEASNAMYNGSAGDENRGAGNRRVVPVPESDAGGMKSKEKSKTANSKRYFRLMHGMVCGGSRGSVVALTRGFRLRDCRTPVSAVSCRPRTTHAH